MMTPPSLGFPSESGTAAAADAGETTAGTARHRKLTDAAQQFEAMFLQQMLKFGSPGENDGSDDDSGGGSQSTYTSFGNEAIAKAISAAGGLGIARQIVQRVERVSAGGNGSGKHAT